GRDGRADDDARRVAERHRAHRMALRVDVDDGDVVEEVVPHDLRGNPVAVRELDVDGVRLLGPAAALTGSRDYVRARQDGAGPGDDEARALRAAGARAAEVRDDRHNARRPAREDLRWLE